MQPHLGHHSAVLPESPHLKHKLWSMKNFLLPNSVVTAIQLSLLWSCFLQKIQPGTDLSYFCVYHVFFRPRWMLCLTLSTLFLFSHFCIASIKSCIDHSSHFSSTLSRSGFTWESLLSVAITKPRKYSPSWRFGAHQIFREVRNFSRN